METIDNLEDEAAEVQKPEGMPPLRPDEPVPEEDFSMEDSVVILDEIYPSEVPAPPKKRIRPEWILAAIALLAAAALAWVAILCRPYYKAADDPEALVVRRHHEEMTEPPVCPGAGNGAGGNGTDLRADHPPGTEPLRPSGLPVQ